MIPCEDSTDEVLSERRCESGRKVASVAYGASSVYLLYFHRGLHREVRVVCSTTYVQEQKVMAPDDRIDLGVGLDCSLTTKHDGPL